MKFWSHWTHNYWQYFSCLVFWLCSDSGHLYLQSQGFQYGLWESHFFRHGLEEYDLMWSGRWMADMRLLWPIHNITHYRDIYLDTKIGGWSLQVWASICHEEISKTYQVTEERWKKLSGWWWKQGEDSKRTLNKSLKCEERGALFNISNPKFKPVMTYIFSFFLSLLLTAFLCIYL